MRDTPVFANLKLLKADMEEKGWIIEAFSFRYKSTNYIAIAKRYLENEERLEYALLKIEFLEANNLEKTLTLPANSYGFIAHPKIIREYFGIVYQKNVQDLMQQFNRTFSLFIPSKVQIGKSALFKEVMIRSLSKNDSEDPTKIYCFNVKRNPDNGRRSIFNDNKSRILRPSLYDKLGIDTNLSFCYSNDKNEECSDSEILIKYAKRK